MILRTLTADECEQIRRWRNAPDVLPILRTKDPITKEQQAVFYRDVVCNLASEHRYYALALLVPEHRPEYGSTVNSAGYMVPNFGKAELFIGVGGLTYIENGRTEISLVLGPAFRGKGYGSQAVDALLDQARRLGLACVVGECYATGNLGFWSAQLKRIAPTRAAIGEDGTLRWEWRL